MLALLSRDPNRFLATLPVGITLAEEVLKLFLETPFDGGRHATRVGEITAIEEEEAR